MLSFFIEKNIRSVVGCRRNQLTDSLQIIQLCNVSIVKTHPIVVTLAECKIVSWFCRCSLRQLFPYPVHNNRRQIVNDIATDAFLILLNLEILRYLDFIGKLEFFLQFCAVGESWQSDDQIIRQSFNPHSFLRLIYTISYSIDIFSTFFTVQLVQYFWLVVLLQHCLNALDIRIVTWWQHKVHKFLQSRPLSTTLQTFNYDFRLSFKANMGRLFDGG